MASFNPPGLRAGCLEEVGITPAYSIDDAATPRRIWELRLKASRRFAPRWLCCCLFWLLLLRAGSALLFGAPMQR